MADTPGPLSSPYGCFVRVYWLILGNALIAFSALFIFMKREGILSPVNLVFWSGVIAVIIFRLIDIQYFAGTTSKGEPANMAVFRKYAMTVVVICALLWGATHTLVYLTSVR
ncbi:MAG TPA: hypothetical protein VEJ63_18350 [Planctomycetota bacterium]|nr:hypothetical protein [Planctomycetota bacterium]